MRSRGSIGLAGGWTGPVRYHGLCLALALGCADARPLDTDDPGDDTDPEVVDTDPADTDTAPPACDPPLGATAGSGVVAVGDLRTIAVSGGTGAPRFAVASGEGSVHATTGVFWAPSSPGSTTVEVRDEGCAGSTTVDLAIVDGVRLEPGAARVPPGTSLAFEVRGGSGEIACQGVFASGGDVDESCAYTAGPDAGVDLVEVVDLATGRRAEARVEVHADHVFRAVGDEVLFLPVGGWTRVEAANGSGAFVVRDASDEGLLDVDGGAVRALAGGVGEIVVTDAWTGAEDRIAVVVPQALFPPDVGWVGEVERGGVALHDEDGVWFGDPKVSLDAGYAGAALWLDPDEHLTVVAAGVGAFERGGSAIARIDADGDGLRDLAIGFPNRQGVTENAGAVAIHGWTGDGLTAEPIWQVDGGPFEVVGSALAACDFDGDGWEDLAVAAQADEDRTVAPIAPDQGGVRVYPGGPEGLTEAPVLRWGLWHDGVGWVGMNGLQLPRRLAAGDFDADGLCDLAVAGWTAPASPGGSPNAGVVHVFRGDAFAMLQPTPARRLVGEAGTQLGTRIAVGDLDGDGADDLAVSAPLDDTAGDNAGKTYVVLAAGLGLGIGAESVVPIAEAAAWAVVGARNNDLLGDAVEIFDADGDGADDLLVAAPRSGWDTARQPLNSGNVAAFGEGLRADLEAGTASATPADADHVWNGPNARAWFGLSFAPWPDEGEDGWVELVGKAGIEGSIGRDVGQYLVVSSEPDVASRALGYPGNPALLSGGESVALVDGEPLAIVGAPDNHREIYFRTGDAWALPLDGGPKAWRPDRHPVVAAGDRFGAVVLPVGDFDGDGLGPDLAVLAPETTRPATISGAVVPPGCALPVADGIAGVAVIHRRSASGWQAAPAALVFGAVGDGHAVSLATGDFDGDGRGDLAMGSDAWQATRGGVRVVFGRALADGVTTVLCDAVDLIGVEAAGRVGAALVGLPDLDGDGCDELAVGAPTEDFREHPRFANDQGVVRVLFGLGATCTTRGALHLTGFMQNARTGSRLAAGDVDGDGAADLAVTTERVDTDDGLEGAVWVTLGARLADLTLVPYPEPLGLVAGRDVALHGLVADPGLALGALYDFREGYGAGLAFVPDPANPARDALAVGAPLLDDHGLDRGVVVLHRWKGPGLDPIPFARLVGDGPLVRAGTAIAGDADRLLVGAPRSSLGGPQYGAVYVAEWP